MIYFQITINQQKFVEQGNIAQQYYRMKKRTIEIGTLVQEIKKNLVKNFEYRKLKF